MLRETPDFDLGAELEQQKFMAANPRVARAETFLSLVEQGDADADAAEAFLNDDPETGGGTPLLYLLPQARLRKLTSQRSITRTRRRKRS